MIPLTIRRICKTKPQYIVLILICFFVIGLVSVGYGQSDNISDLISQLKNSDSSVQMSAIRALAKIGTPAVESLIAAIREQPDSGVRNDLAEALGEIGTPAVDSLITALNDPDFNVRSCAARALGHIRDPRAVEPLIVVLKDRYSDVRTLAAWALGEIKDPLAVGSLIDVLKDPNVEPRRTAVLALGEIKDPRAVEPLIDALKDPDSQVRGYAVRSLGEIADPRAVNALAEYRQNSDQEKSGLVPAENGQTNLSSEVVLKSGQKLEGKITEKTDKYIKIDTGIGISVTYYADEIDTVDGQEFRVPVSSTPVIQAAPQTEINPHPITQVTQPTANILNNDINQQSQPAETNPNAQDTAKEAYDKGLKYYHNGANGKWDEAIAWFNKAIELNPKYIDAYLKRGQAYECKGSYAQANLDLNKAIELNPNSAQAWFIRGYITEFNNGKGEWDQAISNYSKAIELNSNYADAYNRRGNDYYYNFNYEKSISDLTKAIELSPDDEDNYESRGRTYTETDKFDQAIADYNKAIEMNPSDGDENINYHNSWIYEKLGEVYYKESNYAQAISYFSKAIELSPKYSELFYEYRAKAYDANQEYDKAQADENKAKELLGGGDLINPNILGHRSSNFLAYSLAIKFGPIILILVMIPFIGLDFMLLRRRSQQFFEESFSFSRFNIIVFGCFPIFLALADCFTYYPARLLLFISLISTICFYIKRRLQFKYLLRSSEDEKKGNNRSPGVTILGWAFIFLGAGNLLSFGFFINRLGLETVLISILWCFIELILGINVLRLKEWSRKGIIYYCILGALLDMAKLIYFFVTGNKFNHVELKIIHWESIFWGTIISILLYVFTIYFITRPEVKEQFK